ncbi:hypothetical protein POPTR_004G220250v4 [Populus trichocarpa]|uniref:Uncharacterized protein n=1 Tax=Populus trichocarpa TaxID=3694 RepID=A0A3N7EYY9_POPTR|nr:hypothetical protein POPTR_004G220250v4 [Populus trichocarpa]
MFHHLHLSTQPPPPSSLSTFLVHVSQSSPLSTAPPPIFTLNLSRPCFSIFISQHSPPSHLHLSSLNCSHSPPSSSLNLSHGPPSQPPIFISHLSTFLTAPPQHLHLHLSSLSTFR